MEENKDIIIVQDHYNKSAQIEWDRLSLHPFEFIFTTYMMDQYIKAGDSILDIGGGPGRYSLHYAKKGCDVTLIDLAEANITFAIQKAKEENISLKTYVANCLNLNSLNLKTYDHVFLMGPLYHLLNEKDRLLAVNLALKHLKPNGKIYISFIMVFAGIMYDLKYGGNIVSDAQNPAVNSLIEDVHLGKDFKGATFTKAYFYHQRNILPFINQFDLEVLHLFGQEGILAPNEDDILKRSQEEINTWIEIAKKYLECPELLSFSEHAMVIAKKK